MRVFSAAFVAVTLTCLNFVVSLPGVLSIPPSQYWDGNDGSWSTFAVQIGNPGQTVRLLPGTSASAGDIVWVVIGEGCSQDLNEDVVACDSKRGGIFLSNESTTWSIERLSNNGLFQLATPEESLLGLDAAAYCGFDTVDFGLDGENLPMLNQQVIAGFASNDFWLGTLGLSPLSVNFSNFDDPLPSLLTSLRDQDFIGSTSWSYTAGASYQTPPAFGSLTLGGFDTTRFNSSAQLDAIPFGTDISRDLLIYISAITYNTLGSSPLLTQGIYAFIDSMVSAMYLPVVVCQAFEQAFNLTWDPTSGFYLLSAEQHDSLLAQNPSFTITLGTGVEGNDEVDIVVPYAAFDLNITQPYVNNSVRYFPLKQAQNESQYTLGRVLLQEMYVIADYDRRQFSIAQAVFPLLPANPALQAIEPPGTSPNTSTPASNERRHTVLSAGAISGAAIGTVAAVSLVFLGGYLHIRYRKKGTLSEKDLSQSDNDRNSPHEAMSNSLSEAAAADNVIHELGTRRVTASELGDDARVRIPQEAPGDENAIYELDGARRNHMHELP